MFDRTLVMDRLENVPEALEKILRRFSHVRSVDDFVLSEDVNRIQPEPRYDFIYVETEGFNKYKPGSFQELIRNFRAYK